MSTPAKKYLIPNLANACRVLEHLASKRDGLSVGELSADLAIPRTTALRIVKTLLSFNLLKENDHVYSLGTGLIHLGLMAMENLNLHDIGRRALLDLTKRTREASHIGTLSVDRVLLIDVCPCPNPLRSSAPAGTLADLHCSAPGKVLIAYTIDDIPAFFRDRQLAKHTAKSQVSIKEIVTEAELTRKRGYALDNEEYTPGVRCLAAPIRNMRGEVIAAIGVTAPTATFPLKRIPEISRHVTKVAMQASREMGFQYITGEFS